MRIRTLTTLATGAALGAGGVYLLDPDAGKARRRDAVRAAWERGKSVDLARAARRTGGAATSVARRAAAGYRDGATR